MVPEMSEEENEFVKVDALRPNLKDVLGLEKIFIKHAENMNSACARCTVFDSDRDEEPR